MKSHIEIYGSKSAKITKKKKNMLEPLLLLKDGSDFKRINLRV